MVISKCPFRVSLSGGSTDSPAFIDKYGEGKVISFTPDLYTYSTLHEDVNGFNNHRKKYLISYTAFESCDNINQIKNDVVRIVLDFFNVKPLKVSLHADVFSFGSGLASSSSYILNLVSGINSLYGFKMTQENICQIAHKLESKINPLTGYQDPFGCGIGGFKMMHFDNNNNFQVTKLPISIFRYFDFYLIYTNIQRESTKILQSLDLSAAKPLLKEVNRMQEALLTNNYNEVFTCINRSWAIKKETSPEITGSEPLRNLDSSLNKNKLVKAHKLCGAGGGGYFLAITEKNKKIKLDNRHPYIKINTDPTGVMSQNL